MNNRKIIAALCVLAAAVWQYLRRPSRPVPRRRRISMP